MLKETVKVLAVTALLTCRALTFPALAGESNDKLTTLPLHPGITFQQEVDSPICGKKAQINIYHAPYTETLAEYLSWYKDHLKGFHYFHQSWNHRAQEMFYSPDGTTGVSLTGNAVGAGVFSASYLKMSAALTTHEMEAFSPDNPSCK
jgi:hypothetical protein